MKSLFYLLSALLLFPLIGYSQSGPTTQAIPAAPIPATSPNSDPSIMDGLWRVSWEDEAWPYGSIFQLQSGTVGGGAYKIALKEGRRVLQGPNLADGIPLKMAGNGTWTAQLGPKVFTITPHAPNAPSTITAASLDGEWSCRVYGQTNTPFTLKNGSVTGWGEGSGSVVVEPTRLVVTFPNGAQFWLYYVSADEWLGFGKFPADPLSYRPVDWKRAAK